ncbi:MAG: polyprenol monophosphomannose synthase [Thermodesulfobacteriota bacterium]
MKNSLHAEPNQPVVQDGDAKAGVSPSNAAPEVSIILATYNERENILDTIRSIFEHLNGSTEVIVVDDDSEDRTWELVEQLNHPNVVLVRRVATRGLASAFNRGIIESRGKVVGWMDADMCMPPSLLPEMIKKLEQYDIVIGSRYAPGGIDDRSPLRVISSRLINGLAGLVLGYGIKDYDSGFVVLRRSVFDKVSIIPTGYGAYFMEFLYTCRRKGLTVYELPYVFRDRAKGVSKSAPSLYRFLKTGSQYVARIFLARVRRID